MNSSVGSPACLMPPHRQHHGRPPNRGHKGCNYLCSKQPRRHCLCLVHVPVVAAGRLTSCVGSVPRCALVHLVRCVECEAQKVKSK